MIVAITGGTGFVGKRLVKGHLENGDTVRVLTRKSPVSAGLPNKTILFHGNLLNTPESLVPFVRDVDILYHCAAEINHSNLMYDLHVTGTKNLLKAVNGEDIRWVQLSSVGVYGYHKTGDITEQTPKNPQGLYEITKAKSDDLVYAAFLNGKIKASIVRPSIIFAPNMSNQSIFQMIQMIDNNFFFFIGKQGAFANYIHVDNVIEGIIKCGTLPEAVGKIYNISDCMTMEEFVKTIAQALNKPVPKLRIPEKPIRMLIRVLELFPKVPLTTHRIDYLTMSSKYSIEKIKTELCYYHKKTIKDGLIEMVEAWKDYKENQILKI